MRSTMLIDNVFIPVYKCMLGVLDDAFYELGTVR